MADSVHCCDRCLHWTFILVMAAFILKDSSGDALAIEHGGPKEEKMRPEGQAERQSNLPH